MNRDEDRQLEQDRRRDLDLPRISVRTLRTRQRAQEQFRALFGSDLYPEPNRRSRRN